MDKRRSDKQGSIPCTMPEIPSDLILESQLTLIMAYYHENTLILDFKESNFTLNPDLYTDC